MEVGESAAPRLKISRRFQERRGLREWQGNDPREAKEHRLDEKKEKRVLLQQM